MNKTAPAQRRSGIRITFCSCGENLPMKFTSTWKISDPLAQYIIYLRKSRKDMEAEALGQTDTLKRHRAALLSLSESRGLNVVEICEEVVTGDSIAVRPEVQKVLQLVETGSYAGVLVMEVERLARGDTIDQGIIAQTFKYSNTKIITPNKIYDPNNEMDEEYFEFGLFMSRREYNTIKRRLSRGKEASLREGKWISGKTPFGWLREKLPNDKGYKLIPHPEQAPILQQIYNWYTGEGCARIGAKAISTRLNSLGVPTNSGSLWRTDSVLDILRNPANAGWIKSGGRPETKRIVDGAVVVSRPRTRQEDLKLYKGLHDGLISQEQYDKAVALSYSSASPRGKGAWQTVTSLAGLIRCDQCGRVMVRRPSSGGRRDTLLCPSYGCTTVSAWYEDVEDAVLDALRGWLHELEVGNSENSDDHSLLDALAASISADQKQLAKLEVQEARAYEFVETGVYTPEIFLQRSQALAADKQVIISRIEENQRAQDEIARAKQARARLAPAVRHVLETYPLAATPQDKNELLKTVLQKVLYHKQSKSHSKSGSDMRVTLYPLTD